MVRLATFSATLPWRRWPRRKTCLRGSSADKNSLTLVALLACRLCHILGVAAIPLLPACLNEYNFSMNMCAMDAALDSLAVQFCQRRLQGPLTSPKPTSPLKGLQDAVARCALFQVSLTASLCSSRLWSYDWRRLLFFAPGLAVCTDWGDATLR